MRRMGQRIIFLLSCLTCFFPIFFNKHGFNLKGKEITTNLAKGEPASPFCSIAFSHKLGQGGVGRRGQRKNCPSEVKQERETRRTVGRRKVSAAQGEVERLMTQHALSQRGARRTCGRCHAPEPRQTPDPASDPTSHRSPTCPYGPKGVTPPCPCPSSYALTSLTWSGQPACEQAGGHSVSLGEENQGLKDVVICPRLPSW